MAESREQAKRDADQHVREQAETQARLRLAAIVESSDDAIIGKDFNGIITDWNNGAERLYGYSAHEVIGKPISILLPADRRDDFAAIMKKIRAGEMIKHFETVRKKKGGTPVEVSLTVSPIIDPEGQIVGASTVARDISEYKHQVSVLRESEERFRLAMNNVASGVYTLDLQGLVTYVNPAAEIMFGWTNAELLGKKMHDVTHYKHTDGTPFPASECPGLQVLQKGTELHEYEDLFIRKDGNFFPVVYSASPLKKDGRTVGIVVGFRDDTQRREAVRVVRESEERFRLVANAAPVMIWMSGVDKLCTYFNQGWLEFTGRSLSEELGNGWAEGVQPEDLAPCLRTYEQAFDRRETFQMQYRLRRHDGEYRWILDQGVPRFDVDGSFAGYIGSCIDITERKWAEESLRQKERELLEAQRLARVGSWKWDARKDEVTWSEELYRIVGLDPALPAPSYKEHPSLFRSESWERLSRAADEALRNRTSYELDLELVRPDGTTRWVTTRGNPVGDTTGRIVGLLGTAQDITERKLADEALAGMSRKLLEAQEQERARIARELHDDINQRLALLSVEIQRMKEGSPVTYGEQRSRMDELGKRTSEISAVVQSLSHELHSSKLEYLGLVAAMKGFCKEFGGKHQVEIDFSSEGIPSNVPPEISLCLFRVMQEGLQNALKHSGVKLFDVKLRGSPTEIRLAVRDLGKGFDPELAKDTPGLGLVSMQERVRLVKGTISITSKLQSGTEINVRVPLSAGAQTDQAKLAGAWA